MITRIEALNYRCLKYLSHDLRSFELLIGPNSSGKTTFIDVISFLASMVRDGFENALAERTNKHGELLFRKSGSHFELAIELMIPEHLKCFVDKKDLDSVRYEASVGYEDGSSGNFVILEENVLLFKQEKHIRRDIANFPSVAPSSIMTPKSGKGKQLLVSKVRGGNDTFYSETHSTSGKGWTPSFKFGNMKSALGNLPADLERFPVSNWLKDFLVDGVQMFMLNGMKMRQASPPAKHTGFEMDGSNLPWVVERLKKESPEMYNAWIGHLRIALPGLEDIRTGEREDDRHRYLIYRYRDNLELPSWCVSDGTLRITALTLPAYLPDSNGIYMIEEPENGIHPNAAQSVFDSLSSVYCGQVIMASHSPIILSMARPENVICFSKNADGATSAIRGDIHPGLKNWHGEISFETLFASGVLG